MSKFKEEIGDFITLMESKMLLNQHKGGWDRLKIDDLMKLMHQEVRELKAAVDSGNFKEVAMEAADVANYCMMIADKCLKRSLV